MNFIEKILNAITSGITFIGDSIKAFVEFLAKPISFLLSLLEGIFYFVMKLFTVVVEIIMLFVALFQFLGAIVVGFFRTLSSWLGFTPSPSYNMPSNSQKGLDIFLGVIDPTGLLNIVPYIFIFLLWLGFIFKVVQLLGDKGGNIG